MSNETKREVFVDAVDALADAQASGGNVGHQDANLFMAEYEKALPDDLPVIPKEIAYVIKQAKNFDYKLGWVFYAAYSGLWRVSIGNWIRTHADMFARAWLYGYEIDNKS